MKHGSAKTITLFLLRVVAGLLFFPGRRHEACSIGFGGVPAAFGGHPKLLSLVGVAGMLEFYGGAAILLGIFTRPDRLSALGRDGGSLTFNGASAARPMADPEPRRTRVLLCFIFLFLAAHGAGDWSIDAMVAAEKAMKKE